MSLKRSGGFTLIELMIVVAVIAVLAALAYPAYNRYGFRARRSEGQQFLMQIAAAEERFFTTNNVYTTDISSSAGLNFGTILSSSRNQPSYQAAVTLGAANVSYTITGTPINGQVGDACGNLTVTDQNVKLPTTSSNGNCW